MLGDLAVDDGVRPLLLRTETELLGDNRVRREALSVPPGGSGIELSLGLGWVEAVVTDRRLGHRNCRDGGRC